MRIYEIAPGERADVAKNRITSFIKIVRTECSDAWDAYHRTYTMLYRGVKQASNTSMFHSLSRNSRKPMSTSYEEQQKIDSALKAFGFTALRSNSIYCTSNNSDAASYGKPFIIFPKNGFSFTWSPTVGDLYLDMRRNGIGPNTLYNMSYSEIIDIFKFMNTDFDDALKSGNEVLISGEYYACDYEKYEEALTAKMP